MRRGGCIVASPSAPALHSDPTEETAFVSGRGSPGFPSLLPRLPGFLGGAGRAGRAGAWFFKVTCVALDVDFGNYFLCPWPSFLLFRNVDAWPVAVF
jgi:hypothetical protein